MACVLLAVNNDDVVIESDNVMYLFALNMRSDCFFSFYSTCHFLTDDSLQSADKNQQESRAVAGKPHVRCRCKIRYVSKCTAASRGSPCYSTAFFFKGCYTRTLSHVRW